MAITPQNKKLIGETLAQIFAPKLCFSKGYTHDGGCNEIGIVADHLTREHLLSLARLAEKVEDNITLKRSGTGIGITFR